MTIKKLGFLILLFSSFLIIQSCSEDSELVETENSVLERGGGSNGQGNGLSRDNDISTDWIDLLVSIDQYAAGMRPNSTARSLAYINLAAYETAQPAMRNHISNVGYLNGLEIDTELKADRIDYKIALNAAYASTIDHFILNLPEDQRARIAELETSKLERLSRNVSESRVEESIEWGDYVANQVIAYAATDAEGEKQILDPQPTSYIPPTGDGYWTFSAEPERALFPYWGNVRTFIVSTDETTTVAPIAYSEDPNSAYYGEMLEVYTENNTARDEDNEQLWIAEFWSDDVEGLMFSPPMRQFSISNQLVKKFRNDLEETLVLNLKLGFSLNDAAVATWKYKYEHMVMRPSVYIQDFIDESYQTNLYRLIPWPNPTFPGYPSGHSSFASAAAGVFIDAYGSEANFTDRSHEGRTEFRSRPRKFKTFEDMAEENAFSRIPLGVHIRIDCAEGLRLGYEISDAINEYDLER